MVRTAFVSTYPPHGSAVAAHTTELGLAVGNREIVALRPVDQQGTFPVEVHHRIRRDERDDYTRTAAILGTCADGAVLQFEPGAWGGEDGDTILDMLGALDIPAITTLHHLEPAPSARARDVMRAVVDGSTSVVVMTRAAATLMQSAYGIPRGRVHVIPHGVPDLPSAPTDTIRSSLGIAGRDIILSFGMLRPDRGCELVIDALPALRKRFPAATYVIVGATEPGVLARDGEAYRESLQARVDRLRLGDHVRFVDRFVQKMELIRWLQSADVVVTPYLDAEQAASGSLAYAMGSGRPIVSTPFAGAREMLADGRGLLVEADSAAFGSAIGDLIGDPTARAAYGRAAHEFSRTMLWSEVGNAYRRLLATLLGRTPEELDGNGRPMATAGRREGLATVSQRRRNAPVRALGRRPGGR